jgi:hypothetical protein
MGDLTLGSGTPFSCRYLVEHVIRDGIPGGGSGVAAGAEAGLSSRQPGSGREELLGEPSQSTYKAGPVASILDRSIA